MFERSELSPRRISRDKLALFLPNQELIRAFELLVSDVNLAGQKLTELLISNAGTAAALNEALASVVSPDPVPGELVERRERGAQIEATLQIDYSSALAALREEVATVGNKRKRVIRGTVFFAGAAASGTFTITPALASLDLADLRFLGSTRSDNASSNARAELTSTATVTATRTVPASGAETCAFEITEYLP